MTLLPDFDEGAKKDHKSSEQIIAAGGSTPHKCGAGYAGMTYLKLGGKN